MHYIFNHCLQHWLKLICPYSQGCGFSRSHVWISELVHKEGWVLKNWCFQIVVLEKTLDSRLDWSEIKPVNSKGKQPWIFIGRTVAEAAAPILWPPGAKSWLIEKDWFWERLKEKGAAEGKMLRWHHWLNGCEFKQTLGDTEGSWGAWHAAVHGATKNQSV